MKGRALCSSLFCFCPLHIQTLKNPFKQLNAYTLKHPYISSFLTLNF